MIFANRPTLNIYHPSPDISEFVITSKSVCDLYCLLVFNLLALGLSTFPLRLQDLLYDRQDLSCLPTPAPNHPTSIELSEQIRWHGTLDLILIALLVVVSSIATHNRGYLRDTLTVYRGRGVRVTTTRIGWYGYNSTGTSRRISREQIEDILIHEGFIGSKPKLAIAVSEEEEMVVVFPVTFLPSPNFRLC